MESERRVILLGRTVTESEHLRSYLRCVCVCECVCVLQCEIFVRRGIGFIVLVCCSVLQCIAVCCSMLLCVLVFCNVLQTWSWIRFPSMLQCAAVCCSVLQCVAGSCSVLQCVAACCSVLQTWHWIRFFTRVVTCMIASCHVWMSHDTHAQVTYHMNESYQHVCVGSHLNASHHTSSQLDTHDAHVTLGCHWKGGGGNFSKVKRLAPNCKDTQKQWISVFGLPGVET